MWRKKKTRQELIKEYERLALSRSSNPETYRQILRIIGDIEHESSPEQQLKCKECSNDNLPTAKTCIVCNTTL